MAHLNEHHAIGVVWVQPILNIRFELCFVSGKIGGIACIVRHTFRYPFSSTVDSTRSHVIFLLEIYVYVRLRQTIIVKDHLLGYVILSGVKNCLSELAAIRNRSLHLLEKAHQ